MNDLFRNIKSVGFDLDNTLYPVNEEIDTRFVREFSRVLIGKVPDL